MAPGSHHDDGGPMDWGAWGNGGHHGSIHQKPLAWTPKPAASRVEALKNIALPNPIRWQSQKPESKPYPMTDFQVFRAELTCLEPGTEYAFKIGKSSGVYRFRTMPKKATDTITFVSGGDVGINPLPWPTISWRHGKTLICPRGRGPWV